MSKPVALTPSTLLPPGRTAAPHFELSQSLSAALFYGVARWFGHGRVEVSAHRDNSGLMEAGLEATPGTYGSPDNPIKVLRITKLWSQGLAGADETAVGTLLNAARHDGYDEVVIFAGPPTAAKLKKYGFETMQRPGITQDRHPFNMNYKLGPMDQVRFVPTRPNFDRQ